MNAAEEILGVGLERAGADRPAVLTAARGWSWGELVRAVDRCGHALLRAGIARENRVLFLMDDHFALVTAYLAAIKIGAVAVSLNTRLPAADLAVVLADAGGRLLVADPPYRALAAQALAGLAEPPRLIDPDALDDLAAGCPERLDPAAMSPEDMAFWVYTSGTTGTPKAAVHLHQDVLVSDRYLRELFDVRPGDKVFCSSKLFFAYALGHGLLGTLRCGATLVLEPGWATVESVAAAVERHRPDLVFCVPSLYRALLRQGAAQGEAFAAVRHFISGGEKLPRPLLERWQAVTGKPILEGIGTSETLMLFIANTPAAWRPDATGRPLPWTEVELRDEAGQPVTTPGTPGLLWLRFPATFDRYWQRQEQTRAVFRGSWYRPGDVFSVDAEGWWYHLGRGDDLVKVAGQWVSPAEIEDHALAIPGLAEAAAVSTTDADGLTQMALVVVAEPATQPDADALAERLRSTLPRHKCPRRVMYVDEMPRTATGKIQRFKLRQWLADTSPTEKDE